MARRRQPAPVTPSETTDAWAPYVAGWKARARAGQQARFAYVQRARQEATRLAQILAAEFGATKVYLFGSLTRDWGRATSDIDLAVEGLAPDRYREACARIEAETDLPVDLVDLRDAPASLARRIRDEGVVLVEQPSTR